MILLTFGVAILDIHTRLAHLETNIAAILLNNAALGAAADRRHLTNSEN
jgi:hypothetical protein